MERLMELNAFDREVLLVLPVAPNGLSLAELADGLLGDRGQKAIGKVKASMWSIAVALETPLRIRTGNDTLGHAGVGLWGLPSEEMPRVRRFAACLRRRAADDRPEITRPLSSGGTHRHKRCDRTR